MTRQIKLLIFFLNQSIVDIKIIFKKLICLQLCSFIVLYMSYIYSIVYVVLYLNEGGSYTDSPDWMKNKKATLMLSIKNIINSLNTL